MARTTAAKTKKATPTVAIEIHLPGSVPEKMKVVKDYTLGDLVAERNLGSYSAVVIRDNNSFSGKEIVLQKGDTVRVGVQTKNN